MVPTLLGVTFVVFVSIYSMGDRAVAIAGERAKPETVERIRKERGLDRPFLVQYGDLLGDLVRGEFHTSHRTHEKVTTELKHKFPATLELALAAMLLATGVGVVVGVISAVRRGTVLDLGVMVGALAGVSLPIFWLALMLLALFVHLIPDWPAGNRLDPWIFIDARTHFMLVDTLLAGDKEAFVNACKHLLLPAVALATIPMAIIARMTRSSMLEVLGQDFVRTAKAKGLTDRAVYYRHALRNALIPVVTVVGLQFGTLLGGAIITETIFSWPGLGTYVLNAIQNRDADPLLGGTLLVAFCFVLINLLVDLAYGWLDPRIHYS